MKPLVSVIIPVFNRTAYLPECMDSLKAQSHDNLEIIFIDDGSTDGSLELCRKFAAEDSRVVVIAAEHGGVSKARNLGLDAAKGSYVFFVDSDDHPHPRLVESLLDAMLESGAAMAGSRYFFVQQADWSMVDNLIQDANEPAQMVHRTAEESIRDFFYGQSAFGAMGGVMIRTDFLGDTRFLPELIIGEDFYFLYQNLLKGTNVAYLKQKWYYARLHSANSSANYTYEGFWSRFYRRKLVWQSEEALGRTEYANIQKRNGFSVYLKAITRNRMSPAEQKEMRKVIKEHRKELFPAFRLIGKIRYYFSVYLPFTQRLLHKLRR